MSPTLENTGVKQVEYPTHIDVLRKAWWTTRDVAVYLDPQNPSARNARDWMTRAKVRRCTTNYFLTCREWVDAALRRPR